RLACRQPGAGQRPRPRSDRRGHVPRACRRRARPVVLGGAGRAGVDRRCHDAAAPARAGERRRPGGPSTWRRRGMRSDRTRRVRPEHHRPDAEQPTTPSTPLAWYRWYPGDFLRVVRGWPTVARAVYRELLDAQWDLGQLPVSPAELRKLIGVTADEWKVAWSFGAPHFPRSGTGRRNPRLEELRALQVELVERCRRTGQQGNRVRWGKGATVVPFPGGSDA